MASATRFAHRKANRELAHQTCDPTIVEVRRQYLTDVLLWCDAVPHDANGVAPRIANALGPKSRKLVGSGTEAMVSVPIFLPVEN